MLENDILILKEIYRNWLQELGIEYSKKDKIAELEEKLILRGASLEDPEIDKLSKPLQDFIYTATRSQGTIPETSRNKIVKRSYYMVDKYGFNVGSKRSHVASLLASGNWWTRPQLLRQAKKNLGACSQYTLDCVETYLRKNRYDLRTSTNKEGITILKLYE